MSRDRSNIVRGLLILIAIAGHNGAITYSLLCTNQIFNYFNVPCLLLHSLVCDTKPFALPIILDGPVNCVPYAAFIAISCCEAAFGYCSVRSRRDVERHSRDISGLLQFRIPTA
jgi:hypothetical protein